MDCSRASYCRGQKVCPILCITKAALFVVIATFVLYIPLGDPQVRCSKLQITPTKDKSYAVCCLCDFYKFTESALYKTRDLIGTIMCVVGETLYESKLKFYNMLSKVDGRDLCRSICCPENTNEMEKQKSKEIGRCFRTACKCIKNKCSKSINTIP